jgi:xylulokinase
MAYVMGIDLGTGGVKVLLLSTGGEICATASVSYSPDLPQAGYSEQDPVVWWTAVKEAIGLVIDKYPNARGRVSALACSGQMHSSVFLDKDGNSIRKAILWNDTRTTKQTELIYDKVGRERLLKNVSNLALEGFTLPKLLWLRENEPQNYSRLSKLVMPKDYINYRLTGRIATEKSDAAGTLMYDVKNSRWSEEVLSLLDIDEAVLPEVLSSTEVVGEVTGETAALLGHCLVIAGGADNSCAAVGSGMAHSGQGVVSIGTSGTVIGCLDTANVNATGEVHLFNYSVGDSIYAMGCMLSAGESLNWLKRTLFETISFKELDELAALSSKGSNGVVFLPYLFGERTPHNDPNARGMLFGLSGATQKGDIIRSVLEGVAFGIRNMYDCVESFTPLKELTVTGGGAKSELWGQIIADVLNKPLRVNSVSEGPSLGAAFLAAVGSGLSGLEELQGKVLSVERCILPSAEAETYDKYYEVYNRLYMANRDIFKML